MSAEVFHAVDTRDGLEVAIKLFPPARVGVDEFRREAGIAMRNTHENLVRLVDAGVHEDRPFLALEYVDGMNGRALLYREQRTVEQVLDLARQTFAALGAMHRAGLVHGDIKPENCLVQDRHLRVVDFGRARLAHVLQHSDRTHAGTPPYMHPRLWRGAPPDPATDCFAAWVMTYELLAGERPYAREGLRSCPPDQVPRHPTLPDPDLETLVAAGLSGRLADARSSWLALTRYLAGRRDLPVARPPAVVPDPALVAQVVESGRSHRSCAVVGPARATRPLLEAVDRAWRRQGGTTAWITAGWRRDLPLADALSLAADLTESLPGPVLLQAAEAIGPLADALAAAVPATRVWLDAPGAATPEEYERPRPERLELSLRRLLLACPAPTLVLVQDFDRVDGASRRFLRGLVAAGTVDLVAGLPPGEEHGLAAEVALSAAEPALTIDEEAMLEPEARRLLHQARILELPLGPTLARATGRPSGVVERLGHDLEAAGAARWTGKTLVPRDGPLAAPGERRATWLEAAAHLNPVREPWLVARYALLAQDHERLAAVIDPAVEAAARRAPAEALALLQADPRAATPERLLARFRMALVARDVPAAEAALASLRAHSDVDPADLADAEGELSFRRGDTVRAIEAYERAARALGVPVPTGLRGLWHDVRAVIQVRRGRLPAPAPDPRRARVLEALYDLRFSHDNAYLLRLHRLWLAAAPDDPRALAIEVLWRQLLGRPQDAEALDAAIAEGLSEDNDPVGAAVLLLHRGMGRLLAGETTAAFSLGVDAATRLLRAGDPYQAALASTLPTACAIHVVGAGPLARIHGELLRLVRDTGDERAERWAAGTDAVVRWQEGDAQGALSQARAWAEGAAAREDASEALARRFLAELHLEGGRFEAAQEELLTADRVARALHVRMDYTDARAIGLLVADGQARSQGRPGVKGRAGWQRRMDQLTRRFPRWLPRALVAAAWQRRAEGDATAAADRFQAAVDDALGRGQVVDAWWALGQRALALDEDEARASAARLAAQHGLRRRGLE
ncbi:MAG: serine/threonine protein kinase [Alphaproteobacteria bacterium]|nr:serine/threonine protein kinase [Alphaproteobacteria bacterium]